MLARGIRLCNPGNIRLNPNNHWIGQVTPDPDPDFCTFDTMVHGIRALAEILINYQLMHKRRTISEIISLWAPPEENNTTAYIMDVADRTGYDPDATLDMTREDDLTAVVMAIADHECGPDIDQITQAQFDAGVNAALAAKGF
jgi:hypothetical protein